MAVVLGLCPVHQQYPGHREVVRNANSPPPPHPTPYHRIRIHVCGAQLSVYSEVLQEMLLQALLWETLIQGHIFISIKDVCVYT